MYEQNKGKEIAEKIKWEQRFHDEVAIGLFQSWRDNKWISEKEYQRLTTLEI